MLLLPTKKPSVLQSIVLNISLKSLNLKPQLPHLPKFNIFSASKKTVPISRLLADKTLGVFPPFSNAETSAQSTTLAGTFASRKKMFLLLKKEPGAQQFTASNILPKLLNIKPKRSLLLMLTLNSASKRSVLPSGLHADKTPNVFLPFINAKRSAL